MKDDLIGTCELCGKRASRITKHGDGAERKVHLCLLCNEGLVEQQLPYSKIVELVEAAQVAREDRHK